MVAKKVVPLKIVKKKKEQVYDWVKKMCKDQVIMHLYSRIPVNVPVAKDPRKSAKRDKKN